MQLPTKKFSQRPAGTNYVWYVLYSGKATLISIEGLLKEAGCPFTLWVPTYKLCSLRRNDVVTVDKKAYPGYTFVSFLNQEPPAGEEREAWITGIESSMKSQDPQFRILRQPGGFAEGMNEEQLASIDEVLQQMSDQGATLQQYQPEEYVRIISGPFAGTVGQIDSIQHKKVLLKIFFLNKQVRMELPLVHLPFMVVKH